MVLVTNLRQATQHDTWLIKQQTSISVFPMACQRAARAIQTTDTSIQGWSLVTPLWVWHPEGHCGY